MDGSIEPIRPRNPRENANFFSIGTFFYTLPTFFLGYKKELEENDIYEAVSDYKSYNQGDKVEKRWLKELETSKHNERQPSLWKVFFKSFGVEYFIIGITMGFVDIVLKTLQVLSLGELVSSFMNNDHDRSQSDTYINAIKLILYSFLIVLINTPVSTNGYLLGLKLRSVCSFMVYRKSLKLSKTAFGKLSSGQMMNIIANDIKKFEKCTLNTHFLWIGPMQTAVVSYFMYKEVGYSAIVGILSLLLFIPLFSFLGKVYSVYRTKSATRTDERIRIMNEIILGISIIKMFTWEKTFAELVSTYRSLEMKAIKVILYLRGLSSALSILNSRIAVFATIVTHFLIQGNINARQVFTLIGFYNLLRNSMVVFFPDSIALAAEMHVCIKRLTNLLLLEEIQQKTIQNDVGENRAVVIENVSAKWTEATKRNTLTKINLNIQSASVIAVIGSVGSGKTSLLYSILNELPLAEGTIQVRGKISYASQEPWLFPESIKQNILFGTKFDAQRYEEVVKVCALETDLQFLPYSDNTIIGERGSSLSGGQRARVNLARAVYREADIYLLDDPLSAVDTQVGKEIFNKCIKGYLQNKTVVLVTHQLQYLKDVDYLVILEDGVLLAQGTPKELQKTGINFAKFLKEDFTQVDDNVHISSQSKVLTNKDLQNINHSKVQEERRSGSLSKNIYLSYIKAGSNCYFISMTLAFFILVQIFTTCVDYFLAYCVNLKQNELETIKRTLLLSYICLIIVLIVLTIARLFAFTQLCTKASISLHDTMFDSLVRGTMRFFNTNPSGRILNRFSKDLGLIDEYLPPCILDTLSICLLCISVVILVSIVNYWMLLPAIAIIIISYFLRLFYIPTSRSLKRLDGLTRSPVLSYLNYSLQGLATIRAFGIQQTLEKEFSSHQDLNTTVACLFITSSKAFGYCLDLFCVMYLTLVTVGCLFMNEDNTVGGNAGLIITQCLALASIFQWGIRQLTETENHMTAVERVLEYNNIEHEPPFGNPNNTPKKSWPEFGKIHFNNLSLRYFPEEPSILKDLNVTIQPLEKVGVVGRTGAGKSSLIAALFRFTDTKGSIIIDGIDIKTIGLHDLRSKISIIPQEPILFLGTMRKNLDPFNEYSDEDIWKVLEDVELKATISNLISGLDSEITEGGSNLSVGQRQLICLARAMLRKNKILILDEATANVDIVTDMLIQKTIRTKFVDCTVLTIAHRLDTVMDSDKILVMDAGKIVEFDQPHILLENKKSMLFVMTLQTGAIISQTLKDVAKKAYEKRISNFNDVSKNRSKSVNL